MHGAAGGQGRDAPRLKVPFLEQMPPNFGMELSRLDVRPAAEMGWQGMDPGRIAQEAKRAGFDVVVTSRPEQAKRIAAAVQEQGKCLGLGLVSMGEDASSAEALSQLQGLLTQLEESRHEQVVKSKGPGLGWCPGGIVGSGQAIRAHLRPRWSSNLDPP